jgi:hypothetical protein
MRSQGPRLYRSKSDPESRKLENVNNRKAVAAPLFWQPAKEQLGVNQMYVVICEGVYRKNWKGRRSAPTVLSLHHRNINKTQRKYPN